MVVLLVVSTRGGLAGSSVAAQPADEERLDQSAQPSRNTSDQGQVAFSSKDSVCGAVGFAALTPVSSPLRV